jgi:branched-subunit amino acid transport protein
MKAFAVVVAVGLGSYAFRVSMLVVAARRGLPLVLERAARFAVPAAFAALAASSLASTVSAGVGEAVAPIVAVAAAAVAVYRTRSPHAALVVGLPVLWLLTAAVPR